MLMREDPVKHCTHFWKNISKRKIPERCKVSDQQRKQSRYHVTCFFIFFI